MAGIAKGMGERYDGQLVLNILVTLTIAFPPCPSNGRAGTCNCKSYKLHFVTANPELFGIMRIPKHPKENIPGFSFPAFCFNLQGKCFERGQEKAERNDGAVTLRRTGYNTGFRSRAGQNPLISI